MAEPIKATAQYGDLKGTVAIDLADMDKNLLQELARKVGKPKGYFPVGFSIFTEHQPQDRDLSFFVTVYATDADLGVSGNDRSADVRGRDSIPVFAFSGSIEAAELFAILLPRIKRFDLVAQDRLLEDKPMVRMPDR